MVLSFNCPSGQEHWEAGILQSSAFGSYLLAPTKQTYGKKRESGMLFSGDSWGPDPEQSSMQLFVCFLRRDRDFVLVTESLWASAGWRDSVLPSGALVGTLVSIARIRKWSPSVPFPNLEQNNPGKHSHSLSSVLWDTWSPVHASDLVFLLLHPLNCDADRDSASPTRHWAPQDSNHAHPVILFPSTQKDT